MNPIKCVECGQFYKFTENGMNSGSFFIFEIPGEEKRKILYSRESNSLEETQYGENLHWHNPLHIQYAESFMLNSLNN